MCRDFPHHPSASRRVPTSVWMKRKPAQRTQKHELPRQRPNTTTATLHSSGITFDTRVVWLRSEHVLL